MSGEGTHEVLTRAEELLLVNGLWEREKKRENHCPVCALPEIVFIF